MYQDNRDEKEEGLKNHSQLSRGLMGNSARRCNGVVIDATVCMCECVKQAGVWMQATEITRSAFHDRQKGLVAS